MLNDTPSLHLACSVATAAASYITAAFIMDAISTAARGEAGAGRWDTAWEAQEKGMWGRRKREQRWWAEEEERTRCGPEKSEWSCKTGRRRRSHT